jgi:hypothetical protein
VGVVVREGGKPFRSQALDRTTRLSGKTFSGDANFSGLNSPVPQVREEILITYRLRKEINVEGNSLKLQLEKPLKKKPSRKRQ